MAGTSIADLRSFKNFVSLFFEHDFQDFLIDKQDFEF